MPAVRDARESGLNRVLARNIDALLTRRRNEQEASTRDRRVADAITRFTGSMRFVVIHLVVFAVWIAWNLGAFGLPKFDHDFVLLAMEASVEAIFLSTFVLISQNRQAAEADARADLDLQICLLTEHEVTRLIRLVAQIAAKFDISEAADEEVSELAHDVHPEDVLDELEARQ